MINTKMAESATTTPSVIDASKLPRETPGSERNASESDAGSVIFSWLKKKGRSSVGADRSRGYFATAALSPCGVVAPNDRRQSGGFSRSLRRHQYGEVEFGRSRGQDREFL